MSGLSPEMIDAMVAAGLTAEQMAALVKAQLAAQAAADEARRAAKREQAAERQRRKRARDKQDVTHVTHVTRDNALQPVTARDSAPSEVPPKDNNSNPPPTSPSSDADASALPAVSAPEVSVNDQIWNSKAALADLSGKSEESVCRWIGKALKDHPPDVVKQGIDAALRAGTRDPFSYARSVMLNSQGTHNGQQGTRNGRTHSAARPEGTAARVAAIMGYGSEPDLHGSEEERRVPDRPSWPKGRHASGFLDAEPDAAGVYRA
jgi:type II secretory pathway pseudopilin PulG